jgi:hypothetical protein
MAIFGRQELTMMMSARRLARCMNGLSNSFENHCHAVGLYSLSATSAALKQASRDRGNGRWRC